MQAHDIMTAGLALLGVLGLIWLAQRCMQRGPWIRGATVGRLRMVQSLAIDPRRRVVLLECDGREIVVLTGGANDLLLAGPCCTRQVPGGTGCG